MTCDNCRNKVEVKTKNITNEVQKILMFVKDRKVEGKLTIPVLTEVIKGAKTSRIVIDEHTRSDCHGCCSSFDKHDCGRILHQLIREHGIQQRPKVINRNQPPVNYVHCGKNANSFIAGQRTFTFKWNDDKKKGRKKATKEPSELTMGANINKDCLEALLKLNKTFNQKRQPFKITELKALATEVPKDRDSFITIEGIGAKRFDSYGQQFLEVLTQFSRIQSGPATAKKKSPHFTSANGNKSQNQFRKEGAGPSGGSRGLPKPVVRKTPSAAAPPIVPVMPKQLRKTAAQAKKGNKSRFATS